MATATPTMTEAQWVDRFVTRLGSLCEAKHCGGVHPDQLLDLARELFPTLGSVAPETAAEAEFEEWPPFDD